MKEESGANDLITTNLTTTSHEGEKFKILSSKHNLCSWEIQGQIHGPTSNVIKITIAPI